MQPDQPMNDEHIQPLAEDGQTPFQPADPNPSTTGNTTDPLADQTELATDHPATDTGIDSAELYDEGISGAAEVEDNSGQSAVTGMAETNTDVEDAL